MDDAPTTASGGSATRQPPLERLAEVVLIVLVFFIFAGDPAPNVNEPHYLCRLKHYWNPQFGAGDLFLESADTQLALIWLLGWMTPWTSLTATAWVGRLLAWSLLAWGWQRLSWRLVPLRLAAVLSAALFVSLMHVGHLAGEWVVGGVEGKCFAYFFVLLSLSAMLDQHWNAVWFLVGTACAFHPIVGGWSGVLCGGIWLLNDRRLVPPLSMLPGIVAGGMLALIGIAPALWLSVGQPPNVVGEAHRIYVFERLPHHLALLTLPSEEVSRRLLRHSLLIVVLLGLMRTVRQTTKSSPGGTATKASTGLNRIAQFAWGAVLLAIVGFVIELALWNHPLAAAKLLRYYWFRMTDFAVPLAVAMYAVALVAMGIGQKKWWMPWLIAACVAVAAWPLSTLAIQRSMSPVPPAESRVRDLAAWIDACQWAAENTPPDALFLTPRSSQSFKWRAGRAEVATRKDIPQDASSIVAWFGRLKNIFTREVAGVTEWVDSPAELGTERVQQLAAEYGIDYVLAPRDALLWLPVVYQNEEYVIYQIEL